MRKEKIIKGIPASPGISIGNLKFIDFSTVVLLKREISEDDVEKEVKRFKDAVEKALKDLSRIKREIEDKKGSGAGLIFETQIILLKDKEVLDAVEKTIREEHINTEWALEKLVKKYEKIFEGLSDEYIKSRIKDVKDVFRRVSEKLQVTKVEKELGEGKGKILVGEDISPSVFADMFSKGEVDGIVLSGGGTNSHTVILARSFELPAVVGAEKIREEALYEGEEIIVDGIEGNVILSPSSITKDEYQRKREEFRNYLAELKSIRDYESKTADGIRFKLLANIEIPEEVELSLTYGAEGIGLFRTEFLFFTTSGFPDEKEHEKIYGEVLKKMAGREVVIRTLDVGGEKKGGLFKFQVEDNPALGKRGARYFLENDELIKTQLRGILKATRYGKVRILFPMITEIEEIRELKEITFGLSRELKVDDENFEIGVMVEVPSLALIIDKVLSEVDYVSIGTNDLIQYTLAVDRGNSQVSYLYNPLHPSILRIIKIIADEGKRVGKDVQVCGEMASQPFYAILLLSLGVSSISMTPISIPKVKRSLINVNLGKLTKVLKNVTELSSAKEVKEFVYEAILRVSPDAVFKKF